MTYSVMHLIELTGNQFPLLLNAVLNRLPIVVVGRDMELVDDLTASITTLCPHRHKLVFWRDFTSEDEILAAQDEEKHDYEVTRTIVSCLSSNLRLAIDRIRAFSGWVIAVPLGSTVLGVNVTDATLTGLLDNILSSSYNCGVLRVHSPSHVVFELLRPYPATLVVEKSIAEKIVLRKNQSLERIRRLLSKSLRGVDISAGVFDAVLKLEDESEMMTRDMFEEEVSSYVHAARRALTILSRIRLARELGAQTTLTERNLFETIGWDIGELPDMIRFIEAEWYEDFSDCIRSGALLGLGAWVDSMWGT
jgi:hypothetical protein